MKPAVRMCGLLTCLLQASCVPWTVRPIESKSKTAGTESTPANTVNAVWTDKLLPALRTQAVDARELLTALAASPEQARSRWARPQGTGLSYFVVKGTGELLRVDASSRIGVALIDVPPLDGRADLTIQTGPVMRGVGLRDVTGSFPFSGFANQLQFADVANELNLRAQQAVRGKLDASAKKGTPVTFLGVVEAELNSTPPLRWLAPAEIEIGAKK